MYNYTYTCTTNYTYKYTYMISYILIYLTQTHGALKSKQLPWQGPLLHAHDLFGPTGFLHGLQRLRRHGAENGTVSHEIHGCFRGFMGVSWECIV